MQASPGPPVAPPPASSEPVWQLVWSDEFSGSRIDSGKWALAVDCWGGGNDERQCYTDRPENARVADGRQIGRAHVLTPLTHADRLCSRLPHNQTPYTHTH